MNFPNKLLEFDGLPLTDDRRTKIAAHVIGLSVMKGIATLLSRPGQEIVFNDAYNPAAKNYMSLIKDDELSQARKKLQNAQIDGNLHTAARQMQIATGTFTDRFGNKTFHPDENHITAMHFVESSESRDKIDATLDITGLLNDAEASTMQAFYSNRAKANIASSQHESDLRDIVAYTLHESLFWLEH